MHFVFKFLYSFLRESKLVWISLSSIQDIQMCLLNDISCRKLFSITTQNFLLILSISLSIAIKSLLNLYRPSVVVHRHLQPGQTCTVNFEFWTARLGHRVFSKMDWYFHLGLFSCKNGDPKESFAFGFMDLSLMVCLWQRFEIENGQKSQFWHLQFSWILGFCQKHPIFKMSQFLKYPTNFQI